ncbi:PopZ family protein [Mesorhizobium sp. WSM4884]|uniref:PopZ family protein n=1 Tax=Mesorhizobium sp. WSM4884 TaxID=3038542 RepID=UPI0024170277|nr:PopZ family protein [Mesorhizobium sp. WSM4884]MDG4880219.1 PopZ family protein [Mesorhizobium sp. WSM4884]
MATASSAQREPSMEEILASIRRIIEDSDTGRKQPAAEGGDVRQDLQPTPAAPVADVDAFRSELNAESAPRKPVSLAEIQAQLAASDPAAARAETRSEPMKTASAPTTLAEVGARITAEPDTPAVAGAAASVPQSADTIVADWRREIAAVGGSSVKAKVATRPPEVAPEVEIPEVEIDEEDVAEPKAETAAPGKVSGPSSTDLPPARPAILSEHAGRQVAAAFGELSDAFASRSKKTFDEMAEEMLRPMLQDWLDNNLPTLVERLVREEIERVARGAQ